MTNLILGERYIIDKGARNSGEVILLSFGNYFCMVKDPDTGGEWETMKNRLSEIPQGKIEQNETGDKND